jgi:Leucine-rich repeat (LRR) protein
MLEICDGRVNPPLRQAIAEELGVDAQAPFAPADLESVAQIEVGGLSSFEGFECLPGLQRLAVWMSTGRDLSPLADLSLLYVVSITGSTPPDLTTLTVGTRALATSLVEFALTKSAATDLAGLGELENVSNLDLSDNQLSELAPLGSLINLRQLFLHGNQIAHIGPLASLANLQFLYLNRNQVESLDPLDGLAMLGVLNVRANRLTSLEGLDLPDLGVLDAGENRIAALGTLSGLASLTQLDLRENQLADLAGIESLSQLKLLDVSDNPVSALAALVELNELEVLDLSGTDVESLTPLMGMQSVINLDLGATLVSDLSPLLSWPDDFGGPCRKLRVSEGLLDESTTLEVIPTLCAGTWQVEGDSGYLCEKPSCNPL